jgi:hypothetical protein
MKKKVEKKENDVNLENYFSKENILKSKLRERSLTFFRNNYQTNLNYGLFFSLLTVCFVIFGNVSIHLKNKEHKIYLTNVNGQVEKYKVTPERQKTLDDYRKYKLRNNNG